MILFDYKAVGIRLKALLIIAKNISSEIAKMEEEIEELGIFWESEAMGEYAIRLTADMYNARAMLEKIKQSIRELCEIIKRFDESERKVMAMIENM